MFSKKQLFIFSFILALLFHFLFYLGEYGPSMSWFKSSYLYLLAIISALIMIFIYVFSRWRLALKGEPSLFLFEALFLWIIICFIRSLLQMKSGAELEPFLFYNYLGISLFPVLFFIVGLNSGYFSLIIKMLTVYVITATVLSLFFFGYFELQVFLLMPIFYLILIIPVRKKWFGLVIFLVSVGLVIISLTNRAGILRILMSYCILIVMVVVQTMKISKNLIKFLVFCLLMIPLVSLYFGLQGHSVFQFVLGDTESYSQMNPYADTRTFLYYEVFQDLHANHAFLFGKGLNASYASEAFATYSRPVVEVGFLQLLLKTGIVGCLLYFAVLITAIFKALGRSKSYFMKSMGLLLAGYAIMFFIENIIAYNLLNIVIWIIVGMCFSVRMRELTDDEIRSLLIAKKLSPASK